MISPTTSVAIARCGTAGRASTWRPARTAGRRTPFRGEFGASPNRRSACSPKISRGRTRSSSAAAPRTSRPGSRGAVRAPSASTTRKRSSPRRGACSAGTASSSRSSTGTPRRFRTPMRASTSPSRSTARACGPIRDAGFPRPAFGMHRVDWPGDAGVEFHLSHGDWIRLLRSSGFEIENLVEVRPPADATTRYPFVTLEWARRWPCEEAWRARKRS